ncbi:DUF935 domain-containing protein [Desulforegula conservatrix]|uniref:DUF935 domain-containing protein n=1 Tax=Desulforegula conservatrix TaxID=153026 RepID=UPI00041B33EE|nr:DUF935 family protein [Desulforegula conservatrix]
MKLFDRFRKNQSGKITAFSEAEKIDRSRLSEEIASRPHAWDWSGSLGLLPDPDPVLRKLETGDEILESLTADGHLISVIQSRKAKTISREFKFEPGRVEGEKPGPQAEKLLSDFKADLERIDLDILISGILDAPLYGMTPIEIIWDTGNSPFQRGAGGLRITNLKCLPARWFGFDDENNPRFKSIYNQWMGEEIPFGKFVFARHYPTYDNPYGLRLLSRCFWPVTLKKGGLKFWSVLAEKYGMPYLIGEYRQGAPLSEQNEMLNKLFSMVQDACAVIPSGGTVKILETASKASADIHKTLVETMNAEISKIIQGQTLTTEMGKSGSYAASKTHKDILDDYRQADQKLVKTVFEEIAWLYGQINAPGVPTPIMIWQDEEDPKKDFAERDKSLFDAGVNFTKTYYMRQYGLNDDDFELIQTDVGRAEPKRSPTTGSRQAEYAEPKANGEPASIPTSKGGKGDFTPNQQSIENLADKAIQQAADAMKSNEDKILNAIMESTSYEDAIQKLLELYPDLDIDGLAGSLERAMLSAGIFGRWTVQKESSAKGEM